VKTHNVVRCLGDNINLTTFGGPPGDGIPKWPYKMKLLHCSTISIKVETHYVVRCL